MAALTVFGLPAQAETARVLTCLFEKGLSFGLVCRDSYKVTGADSDPESLKYLQDPTGQVTIMEDENGTTMSVGSRDICRHICASYPRSGNNVLLGSSDLERASVEAWNHKEAELFDPPSTALILQLAFFPNTLHIPAPVDENERRLAEVLDGYEDRLAEQEYLAGDEFSLADLFHLPNTAYLCRTEIGYELINGRVNVSRWWETISCRNSWKMVEEMQKKHPGDFELLAMPASPSSSTSIGHDLMEHPSELGQNRAEISRDISAMKHQYQAYQRRERHPVGELNPYSTVIRAARGKPKQRNPPVKPEDQDDASERRLGRKSSMEPYKKKTKDGVGKPRRK